MKAAHPLGLWKKTMPKCLLLFMDKVISTERSLKSHAIAPCEGHICPPCTGRFRPESRRARKSVKRNQRRASTPDQADPLAPSTCPTPQSEKERVKIGEREKGKAGKKRSAKERTHLQCENKGRRMRGTARQKRERDSKDRNSAVTISGGSLRPFGLSILFHS